MRSYVVPRLLTLSIILLWCCCLQVARCSNEDALKVDVKWGPHLQGSKILLPPNLTASRFRGKRFINLATNDKSPQPRKVDKVYDPCLAPENRRGYCRHLGECVLDEFRSNFTRFLDYMCIIEDTFVGVCCPDYMDVLLRNSRPTETIAGVLPAVAYSEDEKPIWEMIDNANITNRNPINLEGRDEKLDQPRNSTRVPKKPRGCGTSTKSGTRIVGGQPADPREWPWMAAILRQKTIQYCGGVLITDRHILTAAHCVQRYKASDLIVRLGEYDFDREDETRTQDFKVIEIRAHPEFDPSTYEHDIAIIKIHRPTIFNSYIWPICLPPISQSFVNRSAVVIGWGTQFYGGPMSTVLMEVPVPVWPQEKCVRSYTQRIPDTAMCAGAYEGGRDACQGDSGGPLLHQLGNGRWVNIGIVSWGIRCGEKGYPGIYTRVNSYLDWIFANAVF